MKALFLKNGTDQDVIIQNILSSNFSQLEIVTANLNDDIIEFLNEAGQISLIIVIVDHQPLTLALQLDKIADCIGILPTIFISSSHVMKSHLKDSILNNQKSNFFVKLPLNSLDLKENVKIVIKLIKETEFEQSVTEFAPEELQPMRIRNFFIFNHVPYDVYIELTSTKFGKIIQKNQNYSHQKIQSYSQKGVKYLYLKKDDSLKFLTTSIKNICKFYEARNMDLKRTILLHQQSVFFIREFIKTLNVTDDVIKLTQLYVESCSQFIRTDSDLGEIFELVIQNRSISFAQQTLLNTYLTRAILLKMDWKSDMAFSKLALASILQDIHLTNEDMIKVRSHNDPYLKSFTEYEQQEFLDHPEKAASIARLFNGFTDVDFILTEHHEHPSGEGFPRGTSLANLTTISCIFILTTNFVAKLSQYPSPYNHTMLKEVLNSLKGVFSSGNLKVPFKELEKVIKAIVAKS